jgi:enamine deaminase RidA (YjgF/YER057c/UK114 family)
MTKTHWMRFGLISALATLVLCVVRAQTPATGMVQRIPIPNSDFPISLGVWVPAGSDTLYLSGSIAPQSNTTGLKDSTRSYGTDTEAQTVAVLEQIAKSLDAQKLSLGNVVMMHAYLVGDPSKGDKMDFSGFMAGYTRFFGSKDQPNKPARTTVQVAALAAPGALVEIEVIAVRPH